LGVLMSQNAYKNKLLKDRQESLGFFRGLIYALPISLIMWWIIIAVLNIIFRFL